MTDTFSIGHFTVDEQATAQNQPRWTWTTGQLRAARHFFNTETVETDQDKDKEIKSPRFAFLKISASPHLAHLQVVRFWLWEKNTAKSRTAFGKLAKEPNFANAHYRFQMNIHQTTTDADCKKNKYELLRQL